MSAEAAAAFLERSETDEAFAAELEALQGDPAAVLAKVREAGYDVTEDEVREAFLERYGAVLSPEQLDSIAAGADAGLIVGATIGGVVGAAAVVAVCAAFAA